MFSKPILIAASVASAEAALMAVSSTAFASGTNPSDATGCGKCLGLTSATWISGGTSSTYGEESAAPTVAFDTSTNILTGGICCGTNAST